MNYPGIEAELEMLARVRARTYMYIPQCETPARELGRLESLLVGYEEALLDHVAAPGPGLLTDLSSFLMDRYGWSASSGPMFQVVDAAGGGEEVWPLFWKCLDEYAAAVRAGTWVPGATGARAG